MPTPEAWVAGEEAVKFSENLLRRRERRPGSLRQSQSHGARGAVGTEWRSSSGGKPYRLNQSPWCRGGIVPTLAVDSQRFPCRPNAGRSLQQEGVFALFRGSCRSSCNRRSPTIFARVTVLTLT